MELRYAPTLNDTASDWLAQVVAACDRHREALPDVPVLLIHGVNDRVIPVSRTWEILTVIPHADAHIFSQCGHWSQVERADEFNQILTSYLSTRI